MRWLKGRVVEKLISHPNNFGVGGLISNHDFLFAVEPPPMLPPHHHHHLPLPFLSANQGYTMSK
jgi:hypothetical protein